MAGRLSGGVVHVVAGVLQDADGRVLLAERPAGKHLAGGWEFPGGKLGAGETRLEGLARELDEEIGVSLVAARPLICIRHRYPDREILLDVWLVTGHRGEPVGLDGQRLRWCPRESLVDVNLLPADRPVVAALRLPERLTVLETPLYRIGGQMTSGRLHGALCDGDADARAALELGAEFLAMRAAMPSHALAALCAAAGVPVFARGVPLAEAWELGATGVNEIDGRELFRRW